MLPENVTISMFSKEYLDDQCLSTSGTFSGKCALKNKKIYVSYKEKLEGIEEPVPTLVTLDENYIQISRTGEVKSSMKFVCKEDTVCKYLTSAGTIDLVIHTKRYATVLGNMSLEIYLDYSLEMNGVETGVHEVYIKIS
ncbi:MAG: DUF1934 domain-containing protein [Lachnospiraceae bacterium]|nr:DUF1934 domain-containing protein [Lachnospiraceae bacterium]